MKLFSVKPSFEEDSSRAIPFEIKEAVRVMGISTPQKISSSEAMVSVAEKIGNQTTSPFLTESTSIVENAHSGIHEKEISAPEQPWNPPAAEQFKPLFDNATPENSQSKKKIVFLAIGLTMLFISGGVAAWYLFKTKPTVSEVPDVPQQFEQESPQEENVPAESPYALDGPNYLSVDIETVTVASLYELLRQSGERMQHAQVNEPVEFLLTDKNNNPIAFTRFAYLMKLELKPELLPLLDESFSLFLYNDAGQIMVGLGLTLADKVTGESLFALQKEGTIPYAFRTFLYEGIVVPKDVVFRSGLYQTQGVRYVNIVATKNISFDYALRGNNWFIGTSKNTLRAILDK